MQEHDLAIAAIGKNMAVGGGTSSIVFMGLGVGEWAAVIGALVAVVGLGIQFYYKRKADRREAELHTRLMKQHGG